MPDRRTALMYWYRDAARIRQHQLAHVLAQHADDLCNVGGTYQIRRHSISLGVYRQFVMLCRKLGLVDKVLLGRSKRGYQGGSDAPGKLCKAMRWTLISAMLVFSKRSGGRW